MSVSYVILDLICASNIKNDIIRAFFNAGFQVREEKISEKSFRLYIPIYYSSISIAIQILRLKINELAGTIITPKGDRLDISLDGIKKMEESLMENIFTEQTVPAIIESTAPTSKTLLDYTPEQWSGLIKTIGVILFKIKTAGSSEKKYLAYPIFIIVAIIFLGVIYLATQKIIDGQSVTFILGIIIGAIIPFLREFIIPEGSE